MFINSMPQNPPTLSPVPKLLRLRALKYDQLIAHSINQLFIFRQYYVFFSIFSAYSIYTYKQFTKLYPSPFLRTKIKFRKFKKHKPLRLKFIYNRNLLTHVANFKKVNTHTSKLPKFNIRQLFSTVLKSRRLLRILWSKFIWKAKTLTSQLLKLSKKNTIMRQTHVITLATALVTCGIAANVFDAYY